jgi:LuxR family maltose regulon positive regulatory protein
MKWKLIFKFAPLNSYAAKLEPICRILLDRAKIQKRWLHVIEYSVLMMRFIKSEAVKQSLLSSAKQLALDEGIELPFVEFSESLPISDKVHANLSLREPLTTRELEVLELIEKGLSNQEIANMLFIALSTVKSYNNSLFGKLEVKRRTEAVAKAKTLGLL